MNKVFIAQLLTHVQELNNGRRARNLNAIGKSYTKIGSALNTLYTSNDVTTALKVEKTLLAGEQNGIDKTSNTHKAILEHIARLDKAERANAMQRKAPGHYHAGALLDHAAKHCDGTAIDSIRVALQECRKHARNQISAIGAEDNMPKRECNILRHGGLIRAERNYVERQADHQEKYASREIRKQAKQSILDSFDAKIRMELRKLEMMPEPRI